MPIRRPILKSCPVRIINLKRSTDRWEAMMSVPWDFDRLKRFPAVDAKTLTEDVKEATVSLRTRHGCRAGVRRSPEDINTWIPVACTLSHIYALEDAYQEALECGSEYVFILEDDATVKKDIEGYASMRELLECNFPPDADKWDLWLLGKIDRESHPWRGQSEEPYVQPSKTWTHPVDFRTIYQYVRTNRGQMKRWESTRSFCQTHAILYKTSCIPMILKMALPIEMHYDCFLSAMIQDGKLVAISSDTNLISQGDFPSLLNHDILTIQCLDQDSMIPYVVGWITVIVVAFALVVLTVRSFIRPAMKSSYTSSFHSLHPSESSNYRDVESPF